MLWVHIDRICVSSQSLELYDLLTDVSYNFCDWLGNDSPCIIGWSVFLRGTTQSSFIKINSKNPWEKNVSEWHLKDYTWLWVSSPKYFKFRAQ